MIRNLFALALALNTAVAFGAGKIQGADVKSLAQITAAGGTVLNLIPDTKLVVTANGINQQLSTAITGGLLGGGGSINLVGNPSFEANGVAGWSTFSATVASGYPTTAPATCSSCSVTIAADTSTPLRQAASLKATSAGVWSAGQGFISTAFTVPPAYRGRTLGLNALYSVLTGAANLNLSGLSTSTLAMVVYDVTNSQWLPVSGANNFVQSVAVGPYSGTVSLNSTTASLQIGVIAINASAGAASVDFDDMSLGPQVTSVGAAMSDFTSYTPTGSWTVNSTYSGKWKRVGDSMEVIAQISLTGAPTSAALSINLPSGYTVDTSKLNQTGINPNIGTDAMTHSGVTYVGQVLAGTTNVFPVYQNNASGSSANVSATTPVTFASGDVVQVSFMVPIVGWSSNTVQSADSDTRQVAFFAGAQSNAGITTTTTTLLWNSSTDTHGGFNGTTTYTVPVSGTYQINMTGIPQTPSSGSTAGTSSWTLLKNGTALVFQGSQYGQTYCGPSNFCSPTPLLWTGPLKAGDALTVTYSQNGGTGPISLNTSTWSVLRMSGSAVVQASDTVSASYSDSSGGSISTGSNIYTYATKIKDDHGSYSAGTYTFSAPGTYMVTAALCTTALTMSTSNVYSLWMNHNGQRCSSSQIQGSGVSQNYCAQTTCIQPFLAGDTLNVLAQSSVATTGTTVGGYNTFGVVRLGGY